MKEGNGSLKSLDAYEKIRDMILTGAKLPGTRLILTDLEKELKIGRGPIRDALMRLDRSGIVKNIPYKGAVVASPPTPKEIKSIFEVRVNLEVKMAIEALDHFSKKDIRELERLYEEMNEFKPNFYSLDRKFHDVIYETSRLSYIYMIVQKLIQTVEAYLNLYRQEKEDCIIFNQDHHKILQAIKNKDKATLASELEINIGRGLTVIEKTFRQFS